MNPLAFVVLLPGIVVGFVIVWWLNRTTLFDPALDRLSRWMLRKYPLAVFNVVLPLTGAYCCSEVIKPPLWVSIGVFVVLSVLQWRQWIALYHTGIILIRPKGYRPELDIVPDDGIKRIYMTPEEYH